MTAGSDEVCDHMWEVHDGALLTHLMAASLHSSSRVERDRQAVVMEERYRIRLERA